MDRFAHCTFCGASFGGIKTWPRKCSACGNESYLNPLPVAVCLLPVDGGLLGIRRAIPPAVGMVALPGGFVDYNEAWEDALTRELFEETGIRIEVSEIRHFRTLSSRVGDNRILIFGVTRPRTWGELPKFVPNHEISETVIIKGPQPLAFPLHTQAAEEYFRELGRGAS